MHSFTVIYLVFLIVLYFHTAPFVVFILINKNYQLIFCNDGYIQFCNFKFYCMTIICHQESIQIFFKLRHFFCCVQI